MGALTIDDKYRNVAHVSHRALGFLRHNLTPVINRFYIVADLNEYLLDLCAGNGSVLTIDTFLFISLCPPNSSTHSSSFPSTTVPQSISTS